MFVNAIKNHSEYYEIIKVSGLTNYKNMIKKITTTIILLDSSQRITIHNNFSFDLKI